MTTGNSFAGITALQCERCGGVGICNYDECDTSDYVAECDECAGLGFLPCRECRGEDGDVAADVELSTDLGSFCVSCIDGGCAPIPVCEIVQRNLVERMTDAGKAWWAAQKVEVLEVRPLDIRALLDEVEGAIPAEAYADGHETVIDVPAVRWDDPTEPAVRAEYQPGKNPTNDECVTQEMEAIK